MNQLFCTTMEYNHRAAKARRERADSDAAPSAAVPGPRTVTRQVYERSGCFKALGFVIVVTNDGDMSATAARIRASSAGASPPDLRRSEGAACRT